MLKKFALTAIAFTAAVAIPATAMPATVMAELDGAAMAEALEQSAAEADTPDMSDIEINDDFLSDGHENPYDTSDGKIHVNIPKIEEKIVSSNETTKDTADTASTISSLFTQDTNVKMTFNIAGSMTAPAAEDGAEPETQDISMTMDGDIKADADSKNILADLTIGMDGDEQSMQTYINFDGNQIVTYSSDDNETWTKSTEDMSAVMSGTSNTENNIDIKGMLGDPVQEDVDGTPCNHYSGTINIEDILSQIQPEIDDAEAAAEEDGAEIDTNAVNSVLSMFDGTEVPVEYYERVEDEKPVKLNIDMSGIDFNSMLSSILGEGYSLEFSELSADFDFTYDDVDVQIPDAVITNASESGAQSEDTDVEMEYDPEGTIK